MTQSPPSSPKLVARMGGGAAAQVRSSQGAGAAQMLRQAFAHYQAGRGEAAQAALAELQKLAPQHPDVLHLEGLLALGRGDAAAAETAIRRAIEAAPEQAGYYSNLGNALRHQNRPAEALAAYDRAVELAPELAGSYLNRGTLRAELEDAEGAIADFRRLIDLNGERPGPWMRLGRYYVQLGRFEAARDVFEEGLARLGRQGALLAALADVLERMSDLDAGLARAQEALDLDRRDAGAARIWARIKRRQGDAQAARDMLERFDPERLPVPLARTVHAELGQIYDRLNRPHEAFSHFVKQNQAAKKLLDASPVRAQTYVDQVADLRACFTADWVGTWRAADVRDDVQPGETAPIFLVGFPRSGTTLLDQILDAHPDIQVIEEKPLLLPVRDAVAAHAGGYPRALGQLDAQTIRALRERYRAALAREGAQAGRHVINKLPLNIIHAGLIQRVFPEAKFLLALRHPCDAVLSCFMQDFQLNASMANFLTLGDAARLYEQVMGLWQTYRQLLPLKVHEIRYEAVVSDLQSEVEGALDFLGLAWDPAMGDPAAHARSRDIRTPSYAQVTEGLYDRASGRWRRYEDLMGDVPERLASFAQAFGYDQG